MLPAMSDWSQISMDDLITIHQAFDSAFVENDGSAHIHLNANHWRRCQAVWASIELEYEERARRGVDEE